MFENATATIQTPSAVAPAYTRLQHLPIEIVVAGLLFACASISIWMTRIPSGVALFWPGNALAASLLIRLPRLRWGAAFAAMFVAVTLANVVVAHRSWSLAALFGSTHLFEVALMVTVFRLVTVFPYPKISIGQAVFMTAVFGLTIPGMSAIAAAMFLGNQLAAPFWICVLQWWSAHVVGACLVGPPVILFSGDEFKRLTRSRFLLENLLTWVAGLLACFFIIRFVRFPFASIGLILLVASARLGGFGTSVMSLSFGFLITNLWLFGIRPVGLDSAAAASTSLVGLPTLAILAALMPPIAVGIGSDLRRAAVRAVRASERRFRESMEHSPIGMLLADMNGIWGYTNIALQQMLGYTAEEFRALPPGGPSNQEDWQESQARWHRLVTGEIQSYSTTRRFHHRAGHWVWTQVAVSILKDESGHPLHLIAQIESLEARHQAEEKVADERERLKITLAAISDAVVTTDSQTHITYINPAAQVLLGLDTNAAEGRRMDEVIHLSDPMSSRAVANLMAQTALHGKIFKRDAPCLLHRPDGSMCFVTDHVSPVLASSGAVNGMVVVFRDSTQEVGRTRGLQHQALHDPLTGLSNRAEFERKLRQVFVVAQRVNRPAALLAIDLDRFKTLNDAAGHAAGDAMLCKVAEACCVSVRASDSVARLGGDEFVIILDNCPELQAHRIGNQVLKALNSLEIEWLGTRYTIGASVGLAMVSVDWKEAKEWVQAADAACYYAKRLGRGQLQSHQAHEPFIAQKAR